MPHRNQELIELCRECKGPATEHCLRCHVPLCEEHAPGYEQRCGPCESEHYDKTEVLRRAAAGEIQSVIGRASIGIIAGIMATTLWPIVFLPTLTGKLVGSAVYFGSLLGLGRWYRKTPPRQLGAKRALREARKRFLRKRAPKQLPAPRDESD